MGLALPETVADRREVVAKDRDCAGCDGARRTLCSIMLVSSYAIFRTDAGAGHLKHVELRSHLEQRPGVDGFRVELADVGHNTRVRSRPLPCCFARRRSSASDGNSRQPTPKLFPFSVETRRPSATASRSRVAT
jgi:hypothetical protein